jgi:hypothetical protein
MAGIKLLVSRLHQLEKYYRDGRKGCTKACSWMHAGALREGLRDLNIAEPVEGDPFPGQSLMMVYQKIRSIDPPEEWAMVIRENGKTTKHSHNCNTLKRQIQTEVFAAFFTLMDGVTMDDFD